MHKTPFSAVQDLRAVQRMVLVDISINGIFSTPITFGLEDEEDDEEGLASVVGEGISTSNAPEISDADSESSDSGNEAEEEKEDKNNKDEENENRDTTAARAVKNDYSAPNSGEITRNNRDLEIEATAFKKKCEGASELDMDGVGIEYHQIASWALSSITTTILWVSGSSHCFTHHTSQWNQ